MPKKISILWNEAKKITASPFVPTHRSDLWREQGWEVRQEGDAFYFEFLAARHGGGTDTYKITKEEFEEVKAGNKVYDDLIRKYDWGAYQPNRKT